MDSPREPLAGSAEIDPLCEEILRHLAENPDVRDTLEGVAEWWLLEREIRRGVARIQRCLDRLVEQGWLAAMAGPDGRTHYRIEPERLPEIRRLAGADAAAPPGEP